MLTHRSLTVALLVCSLPASAQLLTDRGPPQHRIVHRNTVALRVNPLGFIYDGRLAHALRSGDGPADAEPPAVAP